jgi:hypothetical protein
MPTWRADYFDNPKDSAPSRSEIIVAENESDALHEARNKMGSLCSRAEVIPLEGWEFALRFAHEEPSPAHPLRSIPAELFSQV